MDIEYLKFSKILGSPLHFENLEFKYSNPLVQPQISHNKLVFKKISNRKLYKFQRNYQPPYN